MIVGMNYGSEGNRYIAMMNYLSNRTTEERRHAALAAKELFDEVYIIDVINSQKDFIDYIVNHGCRM